MLGQEKGVRRRRREGGEEEEDSTGVPPKKEERGTRGEVGAQSRTSRGRRWEEEAEKGEQQLQVASRKTKGRPRWLLQRRLHRHSGLRPPKRSLAGAWPRSPLQEGGGGERRRGKSQGSGSTPDRTRPARSPAPA